VLKIQAFNRSFYLSFLETVLSFLGIVLSFLGTVLSFLGTYLRFSISSGFHCHLDFICMAVTYPLHPLAVIHPLIQRQCQSCRPVSVSCLRQSHGLAKTCLGVFVYYGLDDSYSFRTCVLYLKAVVFLNILQLSGDQLSC